jgi:hypothetical protein
MKPSNAHTVPGQNGYNNVYSRYVQDDFLRQEFGEGEFSPVHSTEIMFAQKDFLN